MTERHHFHFLLSCIGEGNDKPLQCSCLENPRDGGAWWAAVYGVAQSRTRLKWLSSSSNKLQELVKDGEACHAAVHRVAKIWTWLSNWTELNFFFFFGKMENTMSYPILSIKCYCCITKLCLTLCDLVDCRTPGSTVLCIALSFFIMCTLKYYLLLLLFSC